MISTQQWSRVMELFAEATTMPAQQRESYISETCGADTELRAELVSLLQAHDRTSGPLDGAPVFMDDETAADELVERPGMVVGSYRLLRPIGEGGMGSVWLAERADGVLKRPVALKRPHLSWIGALAGRMELERDILAGLEHASIARLYDAGVTPEGQPYLALEYVEGVPIPEYCSVHELPLRKRLELFLQVLEAVRYAHTHLVIHRDLKPSNILVSTDGRVQLLDFGIAKLLDAQALTDAGAQLAALTPDYASPEQIRGEVMSTASDIYSLGVVLYEMLTGSRPYTLAKRANALADAVSTLAVRPPSTAVSEPALQRQLQGDVDAIVGKALKLVPAERYATAEALAADITRYLRDEPVTARADRAVYRMRKFFLRYRWQSASAALAVIALVTGMAVAMWQARAARMEAARAEQVKSFALSLLDSADSDSGAGVATTAVDLLQSARKTVESELAGRPAIAAELMAAIGYGLIGQGRSEDAAALLEKAVKLSSQANGSDNVRTIDVQVIYAEALYELGKNKEAIALLASLTDRAHRLHDTHAEVDAWRWLSSAQLDAGDPDAAVAAARAAVAAIGPLPANPDRRMLLDASQAHLALANVLSNLNQPGVVVEARAALRFTQQMSGNDRPSATIEMRTMLGIGLAREGEPREGLRELQRAYADSRTLRGDDHPQTTVVANLLGYSSLEAGDLATALSAYQESYDAVLRHESARGPYSVAMAHYGLARAQAAAGEHEHALPHYVEAERLFAETGGALAPLALRSRSARAMSLARLGRLADAELEFTKLSDIPPSSPELASHKGRLAVLRSLQGRHEEAVALAQSCSEGNRTSPSLFVRAQSLEILAAALLAAHRAGDAVAPLEQSIALLTQVQVPESAELAQVTAMLDRARSARTLGHALSSP
jgi:tetratricopeptide (TPR) repeat protein